jgi:hypothetical protein
MPIASLRLAAVILAATSGLTACNAQKTTASQKATGPNQASASHKPIGDPTVPHTLEDRGWGIPWGTIKLPAGWGFNGGVVHGDNCIVSGDNPMWVAESPDKTLGITVLPVLKAGWVSDPQTQGQMRQAGCPMLHSTRAADYLTQVVLPHLHPNFRVVGSAPEPMFAPMAEMFRKQNQQMSQYAVNTPMMQNRNTVDTARVVITYEENGATRVEMASAELSCHEMATRGVGRMPGLDSLDCTSYQTVIVHAPDDGTPVASLATLDVSKSTEKPFFVVVQNPAWQQRFQQVMQQKSQQISQQGNANLAAGRSMAQDNADAFAKQQAIRQGVQDYSSQVHNNVYQNQQSANSQVTGAYAAHMGDYNVYTNNATGQQTQLSNQYNNTYVNSQGNTALQTNSANSPGVDWSQMTPKY